MFRHFQLTILFACLCLTAFGAVYTAHAQEPMRIDVRFVPGTTRASYEHEIQGYDSKEYLFRASQGQRLFVEFRTDNPSSYFNVWAPDADTAMFIGSTSGNSFEGTLSQTGQYRIQVYLMRNAARRNERALYSLDIEIPGADAQSTQQDPDYADGLSGGPDYWEVHNVPADDTLNVRSGPGTGHPVVGELANGDRVRNMGCRMVGQSRWCQIEAGEEQTFTGWVNGRYLREG